MWPVRLSRFQPIIVCHEKNLTGLHMTCTILWDVKLKYKDTRQHIAGFTSLTSPTCGSNHSAYSGTFGLSVRPPSMVSSPATCCPASIYHNHSSRVLNLLPGGGGGYGSRRGSLKGGGGTPTLVGGGGTVMLGLFLVFVKPIFLGLGGHVPPSPPGSAPDYISLVIPSDCIVHAMQRIHVS